MLCFVKTKCIISSESLATDIAFKRLHATVQLDVLLQVVVSSESRTADLADVGLGD